MEIAGKSNINVFKNPYVLDGLVIHVDGEANDWNGVKLFHNPNKKRLMNVVDHCDFTQSWNSLYGLDYTYSQNSIMCDYTNNRVRIKYDSMIDLNEMTKGDFTIEDCIASSQSNEFWSTAITGTLNTEMNTLFLRISAGNYLRATVDDATYTGFPYISISQGASFSTVVNNGIAKFFCNGVPIENIAIPYNHIQDVSWFAPYFKCPCHNIRVYARALNEDEIAHNFKIDKVRFGI